MLKSTVKDPQAGAQVARGGGEGESWPEAPVKGVGCGVPRETRNSLFRTGHFMIRARPRRTRLQISPYP